MLKPGTSSRFSQEQEALLVRHIQTMAEVGYGYSRQDTINLASDYAVLETDLIPSLIAGYITF